MATQLTLDQRIEATPGICGGKPRITGQRIRVQDIVAWYEFHGMTPDEIVAGYPQMTLADVHAALAYYHTHHDEIQRQMADDEAFVDNLRRTDPRSVLKSSGTDANGNRASS
ncbi:MAG: DUF433 domain-containing protein [Planctomycetes bacterium]|nr:DUF433 domain-containing protein [Planctomycetota bacterium]